MKKELKDIFNEVMNLGMVLRQNQLSGWSSESGNYVLENYLKENEQRISKILENDFEEELKVGDKVTFSTECEEEYDIEEGSFGTVLEKYSNLYSGMILYEVGIKSGYEDYFEYVLPRNFLIKL